MLEAGGGLEHGPNEFVEEAAMRRYAAIYALFAGDAFDTRSSEMGLF